MPANNDPIFSRAPDVQWMPTNLTTANTAVDGTGTVVQVFEADATNGGFLQRIRVKALGANVATVVRFFLNNGLTNATATNNQLIGDMTLAATGASQTSAQSDIDYPFNMALPAGYRIYATLGTTVASGFAITAIGGKF